jgi:hypothetical protein
MISYCSRHCPVGKCTYLWARALVHRRTTRQQIAIQSLITASNRHCSRSYSNSAEPHYARRPKVHQYQRNYWYRALHPICQPGTSWFTRYIGDPCDRPDTWALYFPWYILWRSLSLSASHTYVNISVSHRYKLICTLHRTINLLPLVCCTPTSDTIHRRIARHPLKESYVEQLYTQPR